MALGARSMEHNRKAAADIDAFARQLAGLRVLLVDDSRTNQIIVSTLLTKAGVTVRCVEDGPAALETLDSDPYDIVLMDLQLPGMDGYEITRRLRSRPRLAGLPVIALSGYSLKEQQAGAAGIGINDFVTKPVRLDDLLAALARWRPER